MWLIVIILIDATNEMQMSNQVGTVDDEGSRVCVLLEVCCCSRCIGEGNVGGDGGGNRECDAVPGAVLGVCCLC